jgi:hypothetical protein
MNVWIRRAALASTVLAPFRADGTEGTHDAAPHLRFLQGCILVHQ